MKLVSGYEHLGIYEVERKGRTMYKIGNSAYLTLTQAMKEYRKSQVRSSGAQTFIIGVYKGLDLESRVYDRYKYGKMSSAALDVLILGVF